MRVSPAAHQSEHRYGLVQIHAASFVRSLAISLNLRRHRGAEAQPTRRDLLGQLFEPILNWSVEVSDRLQQAERNQGGNGRLVHGRNVISLHSLMAEPSAAGRTFDAEALPHLDALY